MPRAKRINDPAASFWAKVDRKSDDECWEWTACKHHKGYGRLKSMLSHRISWVMHNNREIPKGMLVCHTCDNPPCCNPRHLFLGTPKENTQDMMQKGRQKIVPRRGSDTKRNKVMEDDVVLIRTMFFEGKTLRQIRENYPQLRESAISHIVTGRNWKHMPLQPRIKTSCPSEL